MDGKRLGLGRRATIVVAAGGMAMAMGGGCSPVSTEDVLSETSGDGGRLTSSVAEGVAGQTITLDATGSSPANDTTCARGVRIFLDGVTGSIASRQASVAEEVPLETLDDGTVCRVVNGEFQVKLPSGTPGSAVTRTYTSQTATAKDGIGDDLQVFTSTASVAVKVTTPAASQTPPVTAPSTPAGSTPAGSTPPASDPPAPGGGTPPIAAYPKPDAATCAMTASGAGAPRVGVAFDLFPLVAGAGVYLHVRATDADGIARYDYDTDNDGTPDGSHVIGGADDGRKSGEYVPTPTEGPLAACVRVIDGAGNSAVTGLAGTVGPSTTFTADYWMPPEAPPLKAGQTGAFQVVDPEDGTTLDIDYGDGTAAGVHSADGPGNISFDHAYDRSDLFRATLVQRRGAEVSTRSSMLLTEPSAGRPGAVAAAKGKPVVLPSLLGVKAAKIVSRGKPAVRDGAITTRGAIVRATTSGTLPKALRKARALRGLGLLMNATMVARIDGTLVPTGPKSYGVAGRATVLAQSRRDKRTRACLSLTTDGISTPGSTWTLTGATGKAKRLRAQGTVSPLSVGPPPAAPVPGLTAVTTGKAKGLGACKALVKRLRR